MKMNKMMICHFSRKARVGVIAGQSARAWGAVRTVSEQFALKECKSGREPAAVVPRQVRFDKADVRC
ncbi:hypothetical protein D3C81_2052930 [compost metagenome]